MQLVTCDVLLQGQRAAAQALCGNDPDPHFCRGSGPVWPDWYGTGPLVPSLKTLQLGGRPLAVTNRCSSFNLAQVG